jgi:hypothetical protein
VIEIPIKKIQDWLDNPVGRGLAVPVLVDWPELQLSETQKDENIMARAKNMPPPHADNSIFDVVIGFRFAAPPLPEKTLPVDPALLSGVDSVGSSSLPYSSVPDDGDKLR